MCLQLSDIKAVEVIHNIGEFLVFGLAIYILGVDACNSIVHHSTSTHLSAHLLAACPARFYHNRCVHHSILSTGILVIIRAIIIGYNMSRIYLECSFFETAC